MKFLIVTLVLCCGANLNDVFAYPGSGLFHERVNNDNIRKRQSAPDADVSVTQQLFSAVVTGSYVNPKNNRVTVYIVNATRYFRSS